MEEALTPTGPVRTTEADQERIFEEDPAHPPLPPHQETFKAQIKEAERRSSGLGSDLVLARLNHNDLHLSFKNF